MQQTERRFATEAELAAAERWLDEHSEVLAGLEGQWAAIWDGGIVAHGSSFAEVVKEASHKGYDDPLMVPVMPYPWV